MSVCCVAERPLDPWLLGLPESAKSGQNVCDAECHVGEHLQGLARSPIAFKQDHVFDPCD